MSFASKAAAQARAEIIDLRRKLVAGAEMELADWRASAPARLRASRERILDICAVAIDDVLIRLGNDRIARERAALAAKCDEYAACYASGRAISLILRRDVVVFGSDETGRVHEIPVQDITHTLVAGTSGFGKSVFLHQLVAQLVVHREVDGLVLVDLKGGVEFDRYRDSPKVRTVWEHGDVRREVSRLLTLMKERQALVRASRKKWSGGRTFLIIDEFADVNIPPSRNREGKEAREALLDELAELSRKGRSAGIVIVAATQKPTTDAMDSSLRNNLPTQVCFKIGSRRTAADMFGDLEDIAVDPVRLRKGRFVLRDARRAPRSTCSPMWCRACRIDVEIGKGTMARREHGRQTGRAQRRDILS